MEGLDEDSIAIKGLIKQDHKEISDTDIMINSRDVLRIVKLPTREFAWTAVFVAAALILIYGDEFGGYVTGGG